LRRNDSLTLEDIGIKRKTPRVFRDLEREAKILRNEQQPKRRRKREGGGSNRAPRVASGLRSKKKVSKKGGAEG